MKRMKRTIWVIVGICAFCIAYTHRPSTGGGVFGAPARPAFVLLDQKGLQLSASLFGAISLVGLVVLSVVDLKWASVFDCPGCGHRLTCTECGRGCETAPAKG